MGKLDKIQPIWVDTKGLVKYLLLSHSDKQFLKENRKYKDINKGQRCFILGNGPSLNLYDLSVLSNETVFAVNEFVKHNIPYIIYGLL